MRNMLRSVCCPSLSRDMNPAREGQASHFATGTISLVFLKAATRCAACKLSTSSPRVHLYTSTLPASPLLPSFLPSLLRRNCWIKRRESFRRSQPFRQNRTEVDSAGGQSGRLIIVEWRRSGGGGRRERSHALNAPRRR